MMSHHRLKVYELLKGKPLFHPMEPGSHVGALAVVFGAFPPEELRQRGKYSHHVFKEDGQSIASFLSMSSILINNM